ncbi:MULTISPECIES: archaellar assembly protein FlaJ [Haloarcula]|uniref:Flagellar assembly protein J n=1 Tax=Haloarcula pellucida TaxID=1427151 RepID=A0A830GNI2_9EURY|nr:MULTISPECIES: archaellar assembly protein FlaJ [Halomicroarcula]MBX0349119.1 archaellar assembly protein FlaJ [Halomicroarcula pellucida]MDS0279288.1 archaellar assembly protein FlaJ [Halomicroarcula sp. S1AR25-4]GGN99109.1 flagellar assembly protein J [Halomicroarcula pellucida]
MAQSEAESGIDLTITETVQSLVESYRQMTIPLERYLFFILLPSVAFFVVSTVAALLLDLPMTIRAPIPLLGFLAMTSAIFYPKILLSQRKRELNNRFHLLITHMTVLATTKIDRMEVFRTLAQEEEYGELAMEMHRIVQLVDTWNQSLDDACRRRAKEVPSDAFSDFLDRLAYTLGAGQSLEDYLLSEQEQIIQHYTTVYRSSLDSLEVMKDLYLSMILSMTFALVFAVVLPVLTGTNPTMTVSAVIVMFIFVQSGFFLAIRSMAPYDPVWFHPEEYPSPIEERLDKSMYAGVGLSVVLAFVTVGGMFGISPITLGDLLFFLDTVPLPFYAVVPITPMIIPGIVFRQEEQKVKARDDEFPSFIRALGATEGAKQSTTGMVLRTLRKKDFGPLTANIDDLYKRLNMRIEPTAAWRFFTADCRSYLIQTFSEMYLIGREMGGSPKQLGELIASNMNQVLQLRQKRKQATTTLVGLLYGITAASTFAFFIGLQVVNILAQMSLNLNAGSRLDVNSLINTGVYNIPLIEFLLVIIIMFSAMLSSLMIRTVDGGHKANTYMHFVVLSWIGAITGTFTKWLVTQFLAI